MFDLFQATVEKLNPYRTSNRLLTPALKLGSMTTRMCFQDIVHNIRAGAHTFKTYGNKK